jgi:hypothetical protein
MDQNLLHLFLHIRHQLATNLLLYGRPPPPPDITLSQQYNNILLNKEQLSEYAYMHTYYYIATVHTNIYPLVSYPELIIYRYWLKT